MPPSLFHAGEILLEEVLASPLDVVLQVVFPVDERHVEVEVLSVCVGDVLPQLSHVVLLPLPLVDSEVLHGPGALVHLLDQPHHEGLPAHQPEDGVTQVGGECVLEHLQVRNTANCKNIAIFTV